jgi:hypothetical protein
MTESYPLRWPDGWPRTPAEARDRGRKFILGGYGGGLPTFSHGRHGVLNELDKLGAKNVVISSNVEVRLDGVPRTGIDPNKTTFRDPGVAVYFTLKGRPVAMAQDAFDTVGVNLRSLTLAVDAMRALERHGGGTMMGKAFDGFAALPPPAGSKPKRPWWEVLRFPSNADDRELLSVAEVDARFKTLAKKLHPDAGGEDAEMAELNIARSEAISELEGESR